ncbi:HAD hydrolase family protein [Spiroplasma litorale]|uniref:HAD hydrolase family protein n=1 Tax=Spiroplasma litorale TaxID=216942 RepID=UPI000946321A|nr:HAD hydrolase family protein [Spiroplasma litorale]
MKWWFSDYDGTLTLKKDEYKININTQEFIKSWVKKNQLIITTGRSVDDLKKCIEYLDLGLSYFIINNGAAIIKDNEILYNKTIPMSEREVIYNGLKKLHKRFGIKISDTLNCKILAGIEVGLEKYQENFIWKNWFNVKDIFNDYIDEVITNID